MVLWAIRMWFLVETKSIPPFFVAADGWTAGLGPPMGRTLC
jgi:hypothetical protein